MSQHSYNKIWIHFIWETLGKQKILPKPVRLQISEFLFKYSKEKSIFMKVNFVNADHVHALIDFSEEYKLFVEKYGMRWYT